MQTAQLLIDRPGYAPASLDAAAPIVMERSGDPTSPAWVMCDIETASGRCFMGAVRMTPPQERRGAAQVTRLTGILALSDAISVDLLCARERGRTGMAAWETIPLRIRLIEHPPYDLPGLDPASHEIALARGVWTRELEPIDFSDDSTLLAPFAC